MDRLERIAFTGLSALLLLVFLLPGVRAEELRPDRAGAAYRIVDGERILQFPIRLGKVYPVHRHNRRDTHVLVSLPASSERRGWVRFSPAELIPPSSLAQAASRPSHLYSRGWAVLYGELDGKVDDELEEAVRDMNRNLWTLGYDKARDLMYSSLDAVDGRLRCVYTGMRFPAGRRPGPGPDGELMNAEHTWPQSFFDKREPMRSDLHHLFPTESQSNGTRGHKYFAELDEHEGEAVGPLGARSTEDAFEPPAEHKGNVARALFYFAVQHRDDIPDHEEAALRIWHRQDPVDEAERARNHRIYQVQGSRNPFVDHPELVERISDY